MKLISIALHVLVEIGALLLAGLLIVAAESGWFDDEDGAK